MVSGSLSATAIKCFQVKCALSVHGSGKPGDPWQMPRRLMGFVATGPLRPPSPRGAEAELDRRLRGHPNGRWENFFGPRGLCAWHKGLSQRDIDAKRRPRLQN